PIQAYSQKQLSDISVRLEELSRFVTAPIRTRLNQVQRSLEEKAARVRQTHAVRKRQMVLTANLGQRELEAASLAQQAETLKNSLTGLSQEDRALLDRGKTWQSADEAVQAWKSEIQDLKDGAETLQKSMEFDLAQATPPPGEPEGEVLKQTYDEYRALLTDAASLLRGLTERADKIIAADDASGADSPWCTWEKKIGEFRTAYAAAMQRSSTHSEKLAQLQAIETRVSGYNRETVRLREELKALGKAEENYQTER